MLSTEKHFTVYRSSAGSGKTWTLVAEYIKLALLSNAPGYFQHILAITFTNKAAAELKERVFKAIRMLAQGEVDPNFDQNLADTLCKNLAIDSETLHSRAQKTWKFMLHNYSGIAICTIDSFVYKLVRAFASDLSLDAEFEVDTDIKKLNSRVVDSMLNQLGVDVGTTKSLLQYSVENLQNDKVWNIRESLMGDASNIHDEQAQIHLPKLAELSESDWKELRETLQSEVNSFVETVQSHARKELDFFHGLGLEDHHFYSSMLPKYWKKVIEGTIKTPSAALRSRVHCEKGSWVKKSLHSDIKAIAFGSEGRIAEGFDNFVDELSGADFAIYELRKQILKYWNNLRVLTQLQTYAEEYKEEERLVMVSDFNKAIFDIVRQNDAPFIYERLGEWYHHFLFDEFQDTSLLQWQNFLPLIDNALAKGKESLVVGDSKQAIYRWRNGEVAQFTNLPELYKPLSKTLKIHGDALRREYQEKNLEMNWRSSKTVVEFNNALYSQVAKNSEFLDGDYCHSSQIPALDLSGYVEVKEYVGKRTSERIEILQKEVLETVERCLGDGFMPGDMVVLVRKNAEAVAVSQFLMQAGLEVVTSESLKLNNSVLVRFVLALSKAINGLLSDSVQSEFVACLSLLWPDKYSHFETAMELSTDKGWYRKIEVRKVIAAWEELSLLTSFSMYELVEWIVHYFDFFERGGAFFDTLLNVVAAQGNISQHEFIEWWSQEGGGVSIDSSDKKSGIQVMTVHKAKGLEFPVVIYPLLWGRASGYEFWFEDRDDIIHFPASKVKPVSENSEVMLEEFREEKRQSLLDTMNIVYVATTRPINRLYWLIITKNNPENHPLLGYLYRCLALAFPSWGVEKLIALGSPDKYQSSAGNAPVSLVHYISNPVKINPEIPLEKISFSENVGAKVGAGVHEVLSKLITLDTFDVEAVTSELLGDWSTELLDEVRSHVIRVVGEKKFERWFAISPLNERELIDSDGMVVRPDRVVFMDNEVHVIDYKTGVPEESHKQQVVRYLNVVSQVEKVPVKGFLVYTDTLDLCAVES